MLNGHAMTEREGTTMEAEDITYDERQCTLEATGDPRVFNEGQVLVGEEMVYNTCDKRGVFKDALTNFQQGSTTWFLRGDVAKDSVNNRIFAGHGDITSCDLPIPHYHFSAREIKWVSNTVLVARPVVLYIQDVPVLWLPFIFQDLRPGRHSGLLIPAFGFSDIIRPSPSYSRQITNVGYYWATNDYMDVTGRINWFSGRYVALGFQTDYRWLNRFLSGTFAINKQWETDGGSSLQLRWNHAQRFSLTTNISLEIGYATNTQVINNNAIDPLLNTQQISSQVRFHQAVPLGCRQHRRQPQAGHLERQRHADAAAIRCDTEADRSLDQLDLVADLLLQPGPGVRPAGTVPAVRHPGRYHRLGAVHHRFAHHGGAARDTISLRQLQLAELGPLQRCQRQRARLLVPLAGRG